MISKEEIIKKIGNLLEDLAVKFDRISNPKSDVHPLEFQLFEVQASYFAEHISILRKLEEETVRHDKEEVEILTPNTENVTEGQQQEKEELEKQSKPNEEDALQGSTTINEETPEIKKEIVFTPPISENIGEEEKLDSQDTQEEIPGQDESPAPVAAEPVSPEPQEEKASENTLPSHEVVNKIVIEEKKVSVISDKPMSLNDRLSESRKSMPESNPSQREAPSRIRDIKSVISLNDKLMFIKDLFNGYSLAYSEAIELLNRFETFDDAQRFLQTNYAEKNSWQTKQASVDKLNAILRKRYGS